MMISNDQFTRIAAFTLDADLMIPESALEMAAKLLVDTVGVAAGATNLDVARIARDFAMDFHGSGDTAYSAPMMFDGRYTSLVGAAFAAATQIDNLDGHDGYNPTKGHIGCAVVPALFAFSHMKPDMTGREALSTLVIAYEVAARAGIALHATVSDYHTSGAWNALGVAALGCRVMNCNAEALRQAFGIAEYHGPRSQMMREIDNPTMLHDGSGMGAQIGVSAAILAKRGFEGAPALTVENPGVAQYWRDLGDLWTIEHNYIKPYPICRWAHAAIDAVKKLMAEYDFAVADVTTIDVRTFHEASRLFSGMPQTTSHAQYSLGFAISVMLHHRQIGPEHISGAMLQSSAIAETVKKITIVEDERHSSRFPTGRWSDVTITLKGGRTLVSGDVHARGGPEAPMQAHEVREKYNAMTRNSLPAIRAAQIWNGGAELLSSNAKFGDFTRLVYSPLKEKP